MGEVGDIRRFQDPRQIQKLAGFNLVENSSGKHKGKTRNQWSGPKKIKTWFIYGDDNDSGPPIRSSGNYTKRTSAEKTSR